MAIPFCWATAARGVLTWGGGPCWNPHVLLATRCRWVKACHVSGHLVWSILEGENRVCGIWIHCRMPRTLPSLPPTVNKGRNIFKKKKKKTQKNKNQKRKNQREGEGGKKWLI